MYLIYLVVLKSPKVDPLGDFINQKLYSCLGHRLYTAGADGNAQAIHHLTLEI